MPTPRSEIKSTKLPGHIYVVPSSDTRVLLFSPSDIIDSAMVPAQETYLTHDAVRKLYEAVFDVPEDESPEFRGFDTISAEVLAKAERLVSAARVEASNEQFDSAHLLIDKIKILYRQLRRMVCEAREDIKSKYDHTKGVK